MKPKWVTDLLKEIRDVVGANVAPPGFMAFDKDLQKPKFMRSKAIGFWNTGSIFSTLPHPQDFVDVSWDRMEKHLVLDHLRRGIRVRSYMGLSWCRFQCGEHEMGCAEFSDGVYLWPEGYVHYVEKHAVKPPQDFIDHVKEKKC